MRLAFALALALTLTACGGIDDDPDPGPEVINYGYPPSNWCCYVEDFGSCRSYGEDATLRSVDGVLFCVNGNDEYECHPTASTCYWSDQALQNIP
jgi:hypothetical protein